MGAFGWFVTERVLDWTEELYEKCCPSPPMKPSDAAVFLNTFCEALIERMPEHVRAVFSAYTMLCYQIEFAEQFVGRS